jgi:hypothetical protein
MELLGVERLQRNANKQLDAFREETRAAHAATAATLNEIITTLRGTAAGAAHPQPTPPGPTSKSGGEKAGGRWGERTGKIGEACAVGPVVTGRAADICFVSKLHQPVCSSAPPSPTPAPAPSPTPELLPASQQRHATLPDSDGSHRPGCGGAPADGGRCGQRRRLGVGKLAGTVVAAGKRGALRKQLDKGILQAVLGPEEHDIARKEQAQVMDGPWEEAVLHAALAADPSLSSAAHALSLSGCNLSQRQRTLRSTIRPGHCETPERTAAEARGESSFSDSCGSNGGCRRPLQLSLGPPPSLAQDVDGGSDRDCRSCSSASSNGRTCHGSGHGADENAQQDDRPTRWTSRQGTQGGDSDDSGLQGALVAAAAAAAAAKERLQASRELAARLRATRQSSLDA